jgi:NAD(P)H-hydrate epimerase
VNESGNSGMASGGVGDVLTGMIASFIGQGLEDFSAAVIAVYLHGLAGDIAAEKKGQFSMIATDLLEYLPEAFKRAGI